MINLASLLLLYKNILGSLFHVICFIWTLLKHNLFLLLLLSRLYCFFFVFFVFFFSIFWSNCFMFNLDGYCGVQWGSGTFLFILYVGKKSSSWVFIKELLIRWVMKINNIFTQIFKTVFSFPWLRIVLVLFKKKKIKIILWGFFSF